MANLTTSLLVPKADYIFAQDIYNEIDELGFRISAITRAIKAIGVYDQSAGDSIGRMLEDGGENRLIPVDGWAMFAEKGGLKGVVDWYPVQDVVGVLTVLKQVLSDTIELLYEITGMSDIMRGGNTDQYTAASTNALKAKMGSIQIQSFQDEFARFASELESLKAEVISKHFAPETILKQSNAQFMPQADHDKIQPAIQLMKSEEIKWRIQIKPETMAIADYAQLKNERIEYLTAMGTYLQSAKAMAAEMPDSIPILLEFLKFGMSGFRGADYMEGILDAAIDKFKMQPQQGKENPAASAEAAKQQTLQMQHQLKMQETQAKTQSAIETERVKVMGRIAEIRADAQADQSTEAQTHRNTLIQQQEEHLQTLAEIAANLQADLQVEQFQAQTDIASQNNDHANTLVEIGRNNASKSMG
jgi:hypothetical protein